MAELTASVISQDGLDDPAGVSAASGGDTFDNTGHQFVKVTYVGEGTPTITIPAQKTCNQGVDHDVAVEMEAGNVTPDVKLIGPFDPWWYNDADGLCHITYSAHADLTVAVLHLPRTNGPTA